MNEDHIKNMSETKYSSYIKNKIRWATFVELLHVHKDRKKTKHIHYENLKQPQQYIVSGMSSDNCSLLFNIRCQSVDGFKANFPNMHLQYDCDLCGNYDSQHHAMECSILKKHVPSHIKYSHIFCSVSEQTECTKLF